MSFPPFVSRPSAPVAIVALVAVLATGGCSGGTTASASVATSPMAVASPVGAAIAGWPLPGQATTTSFIPVLASAENVVGRSRLLRRIRRLPDGRRMGRGGGCRPAGQGTGGGARPVRRPGQGGDRRG